MRCLINNSKEMRIYHIIANAMPLTPVKAMIISDVMTNTYLTRLSCQPIVFNFNENIGSSQTSRKDDMATPAISHTGLSIFSHASQPAAKATHKSVLAGVGKPMNDVVCRSSILNLASLSAENIAIAKAVYGNMIPAHSGMHE